MSKHKLKRDFLQGDWPPLEKITYYEWAYILKFYNVPESILREFKDEIGVYNLIREQNISKNFFKELEEEYKEDIKRNKK